MCNAVTYDVLKAVAHAVTHGMSPQIQIQIQTVVTSVGGWCYSAKSKSSADVTRGPGDGLALDR